MIQDWNTIDVGNKKNIIKPKKKFVENKFNKIDNTEVEKIKKINLSVSKIISLRRTKLKIKQKELANQINCKPEVIVSYENGKAIPNQNILIKLERILGVYLSGKKMGLIK